MNTLRLSALSLSLALAVVTLGFTTPSLAVKPMCPGDDHPSCKEDPDPPPPPPATVVYTAELTMGGFIFSPEVVTPNKRGNSYHSEDTLNMSRPGSNPDQMAWDAVFGRCENLLTTLPIESVAVADNWTIDNSGGNEAGTEGSDIRIRFKDVEAVGFPDVDINFDLIGEVENDSGGNVIPFLPVQKNDTSSFTLTEFVIFGDAKRRQSCRSGIQGLSVYSVLKITRTD